MIYEKTKFLNATSIEDKLAAQYWSNPSSIRLKAEKGTNVILLKTSFGVVHYFINDASLRILMLIVRYRSLKRQLKAYRQQIEKVEDARINGDMVISFYLAQLTEFVKSEIVFVKLPAS